MEKFEDDALYKKYLANPKGTYVKAGDIIGVISGTPYIYWNERGEMKADINSSTLRYGKHLHYTLSIDTWNNAIDPICFDENLNGSKIENHEIMFMKLPIALRNTCSDKCSSCNDYFKKIKDNYKLDETD